MRQRQPNCPHLQTDKFGRCEHCGRMLTRWKREDLKTVQLISPEAVRRRTEEREIRVKPTTKSSG